MNQKEDYIWKLVLKIFLNQEVARVEEDCHDIQRHLNDKYLNQWECRSTWRPIRGIQCVKKIVKLVSEGPGAIESCQFWFHFLFRIVFKSKIEFAAPMLHDSLPKSLWHAIVSLICKPPLLIFLPSLFQHFCHDIINNEDIRRMSLCLDIYKTLNFLQGIIFNKHVSLKTKSQDNNSFQKKFLCRQKENEKRTRIKKRVCGFDTTIYLISLMDLFHFSQQFMKDGTFLAKNKLSLTVLL